MPKTIKQLRYLETRMKIIPFKKKKKNTLKKTLTLVIV